MSKFYYLILKGYFKMVTSEKFDPHKILGIKNDAKYEKY